MDSLILHTSYPSCLCYRRPIDIFCSRPKYDGSSSITNHTGCCPLVFRTVRSYKPDEAFSAMKPSRALSSSSPADAAQHQYQINNRRPVGTGSARSEFQYPFSTRNTSSTTHSRDDDLTAIATNDVDFVAGRETVTSPYPEAPPLPKQIVGTACIYPSPLCETDVGASLRVSGNQRPGKRCRCLRRQVHRVPPGPGRSLPQRTARTLRVLQRQQRQPTTTTRQREFGILGRPGRIAVPRR